MVQSPGHIHQLSNLKSSSHDVWEGQNPIGGSFSGPPQTISASSDTTSEKQEETNIRVEKPGIRGKT